MITAWYIDGPEMHCIGAKILVVARGGGIFFVRYLKISIASTVHYVEEVLSIFVQ